MSNDPQPSEVRSAPVANLDILRAIAVTIVLVAHFALTMSGNGPGQRIVFGVDLYTLGRTGVLIFFVHTSLVLMLSMARSSQSGVFFFVDFYVRRIFRIYPLSILLCLTVVGLSIPRNVLGDEFHWFGNWWFVANLALAQNVISAPPVSDPLWSLPYEIQMYLVLPGLFLMLAVPGWRLRFVVLYCAGFAFARYLPLLAFVPCFLAGVLAFKLLGHVRPRLHFGLWPLCVVGAVGAYAAFRPHNEFSVAKNAALCAFIGAAIPCFLNCTYPPVSTAAQLIARYSYGIYLCHYPLMWFCYRKLGQSPPLLQHALFVALMVILPWICFHLVERPLINTGTCLSQKLSARWTSSPTAP